MLQQIIDDIDVVISRDPAAQSRWEVFWCYPGFQALMMHRVAALLWVRRFHFTARWMSSFARFLTGVDIHPAATIGDALFIDHATGVVIGETATIGNNVTLYQGVTLGGISLEKEIRHPQVGDNVIIGAGAKLLGPIHIGNGARIGTNSVVLEDVEENSTVVGVPAHPVNRSGKNKNSNKQDNSAISEVLFEAYGTPSEAAVDPVLEEIMSLKREIAALKKKVK